MTTKPTIFVAWPHDVSRKAVIENANAARGWQAVNAPHSRMSPLFTIPTFWLNCAR